LRLVWFLVKTSTKAKICTTRSRVTGPMRTGPTKRRNSSITSAAITRTAEDTIAVPAEGREH